MPPISSLATTASNPLNCVNLVGGRAPMSPKRGSSPRDKVILFFDFPLAVVRILWQRYTMPTNMTINIRGRTIVIATTMVLVMLSIFSLSVSVSSWLWDVVTNAEAGISAVASGRLSARISVRRESSMEELLVDVKLIRACPSHIFWRELSPESLYSLRGGKTHFAAYSTFRWSQSSKSNMAHSQRSGLFSRLTKSSHGISWIKYEIFVIRFEDSLIVRRLWKLIKTPESICVILLADKSMISKRRLLRNNLSDTRPRALLDRLRNVRFKRFAKASFGDQLVHSLPKKGIEVVWYF